MDLAQGRTAAFFQRQKQQHESYGVPLTHLETPVFRVVRQEPSEMQKKVVLSELLAIERHNCLVALREREQAERGRHAPVVQELADMIAKHTARVEEKRIKAEELALEKPKKKVKRDFFGRTVVEEEEDQENKAEQNPLQLTAKKEQGKEIVKKESMAAAAAEGNPETTKPKGPEVKYKFQEGFTNAVKRRLLVTDFI